MLSVFFAVAGHSIVSLRVIKIKRTSLGVVWPFVPICFTHFVQLSPVQVSEWHNDKILAH